MPCYDVTTAAKANCEGLPWTIRMASAKLRQFWEARDAGGGNASIRYGFGTEEGKTLKKLFPFSKIQREVQLKLSKGFDYVDWTLPELDPSTEPEPLSGPLEGTAYIRTVRDKLTGSISYFALDAQHGILTELAADGARDLQRTYGIPDEPSH